jgi:hypothetical protein
MVSQGEVIWIVAAVGANSGLIADDVVTVAVIMVL